MCETQSFVDGYAALRVWWDRYVGNIKLDTAQRATRCSIGMEVLPCYLNLGITFSVSSRVELTTRSYGIWPP